MSDKNWGQLMPTILVVEDDPHICKFITINLRARGYDTMAAETVQEGLRLLKELVPQLLILDLKLPDATGWQMLREIDSDPMLSKLPVVIVTASSPFSLPDEYSYPNIVKKLIKPFSSFDLTQVVGSVFA